MKKILYPFLAFFLVLFLLLVFNNQFNDKTGKVLSSSVSPVNQEKNLSPEALTYSYEDDAKTIFSVLNSLTQPLSNQEDLAERLSSLKEVKETVVSLKVPAQYQNLHLLFLSVVDNLEKLFTEKQLSLLNQEAKDKNYLIDFTEVQQKISEIERVYSWLKTF